MGVEFAQDPDRDSVLEQSQGVPTKGPDRHECEGARGDGGNVGDHASPPPAQREHRGSEKHPTGNLDKIAQRKEQHEKHQSADPVLQDELSYERQIEVISQSGDLENRQQDAQKETDTKQALIAPDKRDHAIQR